MGSDNASPAATPERAAPESGGAGKWTPGPWKVAPEFSQDHGQFSIGGPDGHEIAAVTAWIGAERLEATANAHLIATAPDLYAALCRVCNELEMPGERGVLHDVPAALEAARAALAKARGAQ